MSIRKLAAGPVLSGPVVGLPWAIAFPEETAGVPAAPANDSPKKSGRLETAVLAGGCFWGMQGVFEHVRGVRGVLAGYSGGPANKAHYEDVGTGATGHAESVQIT